MYYTELNNERHNGVGWGYEVVKRDVMKCICNMLYLLLPFLFILCSRFHPLSGPHITPSCPFNFMVVKIAKDLFFMVFLFLLDKLMLILDHSALRYTYPFSYISYSSLHLILLK